MRSVVWGGSAIGGFSPWPAAFATSWGVNGQASPSCNWSLSLIQEISPHKYHPEFLPRPPKEKDHILLFSGKDVLMQKIHDAPAIPTYAVMSSIMENLAEKLIYLFSIDDAAFYLAPGEPLPSSKDLTLQPVGSFRTFQPVWQAFAGITGSHLNNWYTTHKFCGACGGVFSHCTDQRALICARCGYTDYPKIAPVVIVGVMDNDNLLVTKYAGRVYTNYALIAGFVEIGEAFEDTVRREVMEEVGLKVKNIRYYKSQPWAFSDTLLAGFYADVDGATDITMDTGELAEALWVHRSDIPENADFDINTISLTSEMINSFYNKTFPM